ncbi:multifunctional CCA addition/repair protein [Pseudomonas rhizoryzae]|uniref:multifunctional CCA addition/repair protein n=1 Tax=Pseudomonas rhizoryzae TaxID=2571129 RepID=UPI000736F5DA|nr:multifunctional CCA addition/repair protein [Pseudomonas rhizoryzae]KTT28387.1 tRNA nucleotidyl transferase [Pseudomonas psychrotolerans]KTT29772.1 tRNA nucleotidyl transferase [Pseudomonas psychrotolerans]KTT77614.1 tRNA nucleotidyl transferase [Pseudomonas psychrotolerans]
MQIFKVGGAVRDRLLGRPVTEVDWVVVGASAEALAALGYRPVGADFPVFLHPQTGEEYALARTERKSGRGYGGFTFHAAPDVTLEQDLIRRDLTINAMAEDDHGNVIDPYGGRADLDARLLRHVSPAFAEDPLRVLRVARFAARYSALGFTVAPETLRLMQEMVASGELDALTAERMWKEISRALLEDRPDVFIQVLHDCGALAVLLPELTASFETDSSEPGARLYAPLRQTAEVQASLNVRWACLLLDVPEERHAAITARLKVPREPAELALLLARHWPTALRAQQLTAEDWFELLQSFDVLRRPARFDEFLQACACAAAARPDEDEPPRTLLSLAAEVLRGVAVEPLIAQGFKGAALGEALKQARIDALARLS